MGFDIMKEENKNLMETSETDKAVVEQTNATVNLKKNRVGKGLGISALILGVAGLIVSSITLAMSIGIKKDLASGDAGEALGGAFGLIVQLILSLVALVLSVVALGLGIASIPTSKSKPAKILAIIATVLAAVATIILLIAFLLSFVIK